MTDSISSGKKKTVQTYGATYGVCTGFLALAGSTEDEEDDGGPLARYELRLSVQQLNYLKSIKKTGTYGRTVATVVRTFIDAGVREAIDRKYITITDDGSDD
jgi:hypothetical protein